MKKVLWIVFSLLLAIPLNAQTRLVPKTFTVSFSIPINTFYQRDSQDYSNGHASHYEGSKRMVIEGNKSFLYKGNDTLEFTETKGDQHSGGETSYYYRFIIDTIDKTIKDLSFTYYLNFTSKTEDHLITQYLRFRPLNYVLDVDSKITLSDSLCLQKIDSIYFADEFRYESSYLVWIVEKMTFSSISNTTPASLAMEIFFDTITNASILTESNCTKIKIKDRILPALPSSNYRGMAIFDLLGREVYKSEIPPNTSEWVVDWKQKGIYMIQIGNEIQKVILP